MSEPDYRGFAQWVMQNGPWEGHDLDGADVQEAAVRFGVVKEVKYDPAIHGESEFDVEPGEAWYVMAEDKP